MKNHPWIDIIHVAYIIGSIAAIVISLYYKIDPKIITLLIFIIIMVGLSVFYYREIFLRFLKYIYLSFVADKKILDLLSDGENSNCKEGNAFKKMHSSVLSLVASEKDNREKIDKMHSAILSLSTSETASKFFFFDKMDEVYIIYSHRVEMQHEGYVYQAPLDEIDIINKLQSLARYRLGNAHVYLKCCDKVNFDEIKGKNIISIGDTTNNTVTKHLEKQLIMFYKEVYCLDKDKNIYYLVDGIKHTELIKGYRSMTTRNKGYGLITRAQNPNNPLSSFAILLGGCGREGQLAITHWLNQYDKLNSLDSKYSNKLIQFIVEGEISGTLSDPKVNDSRITSDKSDEYIIVLPFRE